MSPQAAPPRRSLWPWPLLALLVTAWPVHPAEESTDLPELTLPSLWTRSVNARLWSGYKDNVLLGNQNVVDSAFLAGGMDLLAFRLPANGWESLLLGTVDYTRYVGAPRVDQEMTAIGQAQTSKTFGHGWKAGLSAEYIYFDQVLDASLLQEVLRSIQVEGHSVTLRPSVSKSLSRDYRLELELPGTRQFFNEFIDDYWEIGPKTTLTRTIGTRGDLAASYQFSQRLHDSRQAREPDGQLQPGTRLHFYQHEVALNWRQHWDSAKRWRTTTKLSLQRNEDNGGGYYDYLRPQFSQQIRYRAEKWELRADARLSYYHYDHQRADGPESPRREKTYLRLGLRGERALTKSLRLFAQYDYERALSNIDLDEYTVNTVFAGFDWEF